MISAGADKVKPILETVIIISGQQRREVCRTRETVIPRSRPAESVSAALRTDPFLSAQ